MKEDSIKQAGNHIFSFLSAFAKPYDNFIMYIRTGKLFSPLDEFKNYIYFGFSVKYVKRLKFALISEK
jgi:hypothetical protein